MLCPPVSFCLVLSNPPNHPGAIGEKSRLIRLPMHKADELLQIAKVSEDLQDEPCPESKVSRTPGQRLHGPFSNPATKFNALIVVAGPPAEQGGLAVYVFCKAPVEVRAVCRDGEAKLESWLS
jgi:hypothetical protein